VEYVIQALGVLVVTMVITALKHHWARRRRTQVLAGVGAEVHAALVTENGRARRGHLALSPGNLRWRARRGGEQLDLKKAVVLHTWTATGWRAHPDEAMVRVALPAGRTVQLQLFEGDATTLAEVLEMDVQGLPVVPAPPVPPRWNTWAIVSVCVGIAVIGLFAAMAVSANPVTATVTGGDGHGSCDVSWPTAGGEARGSVDCADEAPGTARTIWVMSDEPGDVVDPASFAWVMLGIGVFLGAPGAVRLLVVRRRRRALEPR
jgi:hypothetical protein